VTHEKMTDSLTFCMLLARYVLINPGMHSPPECQRGRNS
jgi:hypothetical protein